MHKYEETVSIPESPWIDPFYQNCWEQGNSKHTPRTASGIVVGSVFESSTLLLHLLFTRDLDQQSAPDLTFLSRKTQTAAR